MGNRQNMIRDFNPLNTEPTPSMEIKDESFIEQIYLNSGSLPNKTDENVFQLVQQREIDAKKYYSSPRNKVNILKRFIPTVKSSNSDTRYSHRVFCGAFSADGNLFMTATQDRKIRFYEPRSWKKKKEVVAGDVGWSILDTDFSSDQRWLIYSGWSDCINLCNVIGTHEIHDQLMINSSSYHFCLFSVKFSPDSNEILGGSNDCCLYIYDLNRRDLTMKIQAHDNDINTVAYGEENNNNLILSGSDDCLCKVWDRRLMGKQIEPVGVMVGHQQGITHISPMGDGRYFISNGKDQCIKLWDIRMMQNDQQTKKYSRSSYDYRYGVLGFQDKNLPDRSIMTYRSHLVTKTLIRCYFSPKISTGQRYIYSGSSDGFVYVYDILSGEVIAKLGSHNGVVRDLSWHPTEPWLVSTSWDGSIINWEYDGTGSTKYDFTQKENFIEDEDY